jgi:sugar phosphate isomerase/epimerase
VGNVADFNEQFVVNVRGRREAARDRGRYREGHRYAHLAPFYSPEPGVVVLPAQLGAGWWELVARQLEWDGVTVHSGIAGDDVGLGRALEQRPALVNELRASGLPVVPWGRTAELERLLGNAGDGVGAAVRRFESKAEALELFRRVAVGHPGVAVAQQERVGSGRQLVRLVEDRVRGGDTVVLKSEYGVGGYGTVIVTPGLVAAAGGAKALVRRLMAEEELLPGHAVLVESYIRAAARMADLTFDAVVGEDGRVHPVGVGVMRVDRTKYQGATVGPGVVPDEVAERLVSFGTEVGRELARHGYRGWFDIDVVRDLEGKLAPTETNLRLTGPAVAFMVRARLDRVRGEAHVVRTLDQLSLGARLPEQALVEHMGRLIELCEPLGAVVVPTLPGSSFEAAPTVGVAIAGTSVEVLDAAESRVRAANAALGDAFGGLVKAPNAVG